MFLLFKESEPQLSYKQGSYKKENLEIFASALFLNLDLAYPGRMQQNSIWCKVGENVMFVTIFS